MRMRKVWIILSLVILNTNGQEIEDMVECNAISINHQELEQMNIKEQEEYVNIELFF
jgi:hypothetical protein